MAAEDVVVNLDPSLADKLMNMFEVKSAAMDAARKVASIAQGNAPHESGDYAGGIVAEETPHGARVVASDPKSAFIEFGVPGRNQPARWILRNAAVAAGLKFTKRS